MDITAMPCLMPWMHGTSFYAEQKDEPCERKRQRKTFAACVSWKPPLGEYLDFIEGQPRVMLSASSIHFLLEKTLRRYCICMA
jgi:hypothetical protein